MGVHKQRVSFTDTAFAFARELVESGAYPNISAVVTGELARARTARERERWRFEAEVRRRLALQPDASEPIAATATFTTDARAHLAKRGAAGSGSGFRLSTAEKPRHRIIRGLAR